MDVLSILDLLSSYEKLFSEKPNGKKDEEEESTNQLN